MGTAHEQRTEEGAIIVGLGLAALLVAMALVVTTLAAGTAGHLRPWWERERDVVG